jgi:hypothetical protein
MVGPNPRLNPAESAMELRKISLESIPAALDKAKHYRLLQDPTNAESICRDVLDIDPSNQPATAQLILALTDQFDGGSALINDAKTYAARLESDYDRSYFGGLICERAGKATIAGHRPGWQHEAYAWLRQAMQHFDRAENLADDPSNDDPILRWNACARLIQKHHLTPPADDEFRPYGD